MNSETIYSILTSKPHNPHYLKRYFKFILWCKENPTEDDYTEDHHICPKSDDLFPEYISFQENPWNSASMSTREHIISHILLWKAYPDTKMSMAIDCMLGNFNASTNTRLINRKIPTCIQIRYLAAARKAAAYKRAEYVRGKATFKDSEGKKYFLETDDPMIQILNLKGIRSGHTNTPEANEKHRHTKFLGSTRQLYFLDKKVTVALFSPEYDTFKSQGWNDELTDDDRRFIKDKVNKMNSEFWTGRARYATQDGQYHGSYLKDDPIIKELNLMKYHTEAQAQQNKERVKGATAAKLGSAIYNNGIEEKFLRAPIDETWVLGRLPRSTEWEEKRVSAAREACAGTMTYNDGKRNIRVKPGDFIDPSWVKGMKPQKVREFKFTDGQVVIKCTLQDVPDGFVRVK